MGACETKPKVNNDDAEFLTVTSRSSLPSPRDQVRRHSSPSPTDGIHKKEASVLELAWANHALGHMWPRFDQLARYVAENKMLPILQAKLEPKLKDKFKSLKLSEFTLGQVPPVMGPVQTSVGTAGSTRMLLNGEYFSDMHVEFNLDTTLGKVSFGMKNFMMAGQLVFHFHPFYQSAPGTGGVSAYFLNSPDMVFDFSGHAELANFPGLKELIIGVVSNYLDQKMVLPNLVSQVMNFADFKLYPLAFQSGTPCGLLEVRIVKAVTQRRTSNSPKATKKRIRRDKSSSSNNGAKTSVLDGLMSAGKAAAKSIHDAVEAVDEGIGRLAGKIMDPYIQLKLGEKICHTELKQQSDTFEFFVHDPEQHLQITLMDRDFSSADDEIAHAPPLTIAQAVASSGKTICLVEDDDSKFHVEVQIQAAFMTLKPGKVAPKGRCLQMTRVKELHQAGFGLKGKKIAVRLEQEKEVVTHRPATQLPGVDDNKNAKPVIAQIRQNMTQAGHAPAAIDKAVDLAPIATTRFGLNRTHAFLMEEAAISTATLKMSLIEIVPQANEGRQSMAQRMVDKLQAKTNPDGPEEVVLGSHTWKLSAVSQMKDMETIEAKIFNTKYGEIEAGVHISLTGLEYSSKTHWDLADLVNDDGS